MTTINKPNSSTFANIEKNWDGSYTASVMQGEGFDRVFFAAKTLKTEAGVRNWVARRFSF